LALLVVALLVLLVPFLVGLLMGRFAVVVIVVKRAWGGGSGGEVLQNGGQEGVEFGDLRLDAGQVLRCFCGGCCAGGTALEEAEGEFLPVPEGCVVELGDG
jgi:hypothetical protein